jgi:hypothetical protein
VAGANTLICKETTMAGYSNPYILRTYPDLGDRVSVLMRNPKLLPPAEITPRDVPVDDRGQPLDQADAQQAMFEVIARIVVKWRVFDGSAAAPDLPELNLDADPETLEAQVAALSAAEQDPLGAVTPENVARLPLVIINDISSVIGEVAEGPR